MIDNPGTDFVGFGCDIRYDVEAGANIRKENGKYVITTGLGYEMRAFPNISSTDQALYRKGGQEAWKYFDIVETSPEVYVFKTVHNTYLTRTRAYNISTNADQRYAQAFQIVLASDDFQNVTLPKNSPYKYGQILSLAQADGKSVMIEFPKTLKRWGTYTDTLAWMQPNGQ